MSRSSSWASRVSRRDGARQRAFRTTDRSWRIGRGSNPLVQSKDYRPGACARASAMPGLNLQDHHSPRHAALSGALRSLARRVSCVDLAAFCLAVARSPAHSSRCCRRPDAWLAVLAGTQFSHRAKLGWHWRPPGDAPGARPRVRVVGDSWEPPAQLDNGRQLSLFIEDGTDRGGIGFGDDKHPQSMTRAHHGWQMKSAS
jgi:hypothetical protein